MSRNIGYHTRLRSDNTQKVTGGSVGGQIDQETVERLVNSQFKVIVTAGGWPVFVDKYGREVELYLHVDPETTEKGKAALAEWRREKELEEQRQAMVRDEIATLMAGLSNDEILRRLKA